VGHIVTLLGVYQSSIFDVADSLERKPVELLEPLRYCAERQCVQDQPEHYCHVCTLEPPDDEDSTDEDPQINGWELSAILLPKMEMIVERFETYIKDASFRK
jgi:hypothetical protein